MCNENHVRKPCAKNGLAVCLLMVEVPQRGAQQHDW